MQAVEALTRIIELADRYHRDLQLKDPVELFEEGGSALDERERGHLAVAVCQAILNTALPPVARFRCFVEIDNFQPRRNSKDLEKEIREEFTICGITISSIRGGLLGLGELKTNVRITLWEQRATGADMISGYQGPTRTPDYNRWLKSLHELEPFKVVQ